MEQRETEEEMTMSTLADQQVYPTVEPNEWSPPSQELGMTLRQYYAGLAMQGILSSRPNPKEWAEYAEACVDMADALIAELEKQKP